ncbi:uroporphyrinogen-III synthase [Chryseobacterium carnipullorum]|uniref:Uroporphyrinogen-III synthase n=1 Tax=Chryseobacterium carnipullorum TaxID=1124835 RepID=A0A376EMY9_CHRCU|nr:uroporphyrinogen-III synthase [Chryseobacterium carnipullorum]AZA47653.1 uroporphyrinogen-III synthase [Chryseobacterium carnipullorum]AZA66978.1 uroporphyrinogen-III synthase [Chryseobacterium carnipullorum]STD11101.1 uroporphyrinogen-III synthase [Chryseobacterium carnipullorum]HBV15491.1 uroporphyrinogen-III synthase [Chryseobacterium carnipullorum]
MKILFTKTIDAPLLSKELGSDISADCIEVIRTEPIKTAAFDLKNHSLIFTSVNGVRSFFKNQFKPNEDFTAKNYNKIYCVGEKTKRELRKYGFGTFKVLKNAETLSRFITGKCQHEQFLHFCGNLAIDVLDQELPLQNIRYKKITIYKTEEIQPLISEKYHAAVFFSPSGVRSFAKLNSLEGMKIFSIGETTSGELRKYTKEKIFTSEENNLASIFGLIKKEL